MSNLTTFLGVAVIVIVTPGPDTALTIRNTLLGGRRGGMCTAGGVALGQAVWAVATSAGVAVLLTASQPIFTAVSLVGAAYLVWLGIQALLAAFSSSRSPLSPGTGDTSTRRLAPLVALRQGAVSNLTNPKMAAFFPSLLPQLVPAGHASFSALLTLGLLFCVMTLVWLTAYAVAVSRAGDILRRPAIRRGLEGLTGAALVALGLRLATERR
jgi:threonine/homoserine/homoserine lactone efflux protein